VLFFKTINIANSTWQVPCKLHIDVSIVSVAIYQFFNISMGTRTTIPKEIQEQILSRIKNEGVSVAKAAEEHVVLQVQASNNR